MQLEPRYLFPFDRHFRKDDRLFIRLFTLDRSWYRMLLTRYRSQMKWMNSIDFKETILTFNFSTITHLTFNDNQSFVD